MNRDELHTSITALIHAEAEALRKDMGLYERVDFKACVKLAEEITKLIEEHAKVRIEVNRGVAEVTECPDWIEVSIDDQDTLDEEAMPCVQCHSAEWSSLLGGICDSCRKTNATK